jgi:hypothetical protein
MLKSMQAGIATADRALIDLMFTHTKSDAEDAAKGRNAIAQLSAYRMLVSDFSGLKDVSDYATKLAAVKASAELKTALKREHQEIIDQIALEDEIAPKLQAYTDGSADDLMALRDQVLQAMGRLRDQAAHAKSEVDRNVAQRAFSQLWAQEIEAGQQELEAHHLQKAEACFQLTSAASEKVWPELLLAETHTAMGNKKQALKDLREAVRRGLKDPQLIEDDERLQGLAGELELQKLVQELKAK